MPAETPFPQSAQYLEAIQQSAEFICQKQQISINNAAIERLLTSPAFSESFERLSSFPGLALPLKFSSHLDELNVLSVLALLNFGSAFEVPLRTQTGYGASNATKALIFSMYISSNTTEGDLLSSKGMATIASAKVAELMGVNVHVEKAHPQLAGVTVGELGGPMYQFVELITKVLNETGRKLSSSGYPNLGFLIAEALKQGGGQGTTASPEPVLERIIRAVPAFQDAALVDGELVYVYSKAIFLLNAISVRFGSISPPPFPIPLTTMLPSSADGILPSLLVHLGVIDISSSPKLNALHLGSQEGTLNQLLEQKATGNPGQGEEGLVVSEEQAFLLRAAAIVAIASFPAIGSAMTSDSEEKPWLKTLSVAQVHSWLSAVVKDRPDYRDLPTVVYRETVYF